jgi:hypothetical protein
MRRPLTSDAKCSVMTMVPFCRDRGLALNCGSQLGDWQAFGPTSCRSWHRQRSTALHIRSSGQFARPCVFRPQPRRHRSGAIWTSPDQAPLDSSVLQTRP